MLGIRGAGGTMYLSFGDYASVNDARPLFPHRSLQPLDPATNSPVDVFSPAVAAVVGVEFHGGAVLPEEPLGLLGHSEWAYPIVGACQGVSDSLSFESGWLVRVCVNRRVVRSPLSKFRSFRALIYRFKRLLH